MKKYLSLVVGLICLASPILADDDTEQLEKVRKLIAGLDPKQGVITLDDGLATLNVPETFAFLDQKDAKTVLTDIWGNPPDSAVLGMIVPKDFNPIGDNAWAVEIYYDPSGYVSDKDANTMDYGKLLTQLQQDARDANKDREEKGYPAVKLIGWAAPPRYDAATHKFYWAKELQFGQDSDHTLNYNIRVLGRGGVLVLNAIADMNQLPEIEKDMPAVIDMVNFKEGKRYADFDPKIDRVAGYGLAALVLGGVAAKAGLFKGLLALLFAFKKFIVIGVVALGAAISRFFKRQ